MPAGLPKRVFNRIPTAMLGQPPDVMPDQMPDRMPKTYVGQNAAWRESLEENNQHLFPVSKILVLFFFWYRCLVL